jgi:hypothetical protein
MDAGGLKDGDELRTYESGGKCTIRFTCLNPPGDDTYLLDYQDGLYWPQSGPFRPIDEKQTVWEIDAHIGSTGYHGLQLVTADSLGNALIRYYRKVVAQNQNRKEKLRSKIDVKLLDPLKTLLNAQLTRLTIHTSPYAPLLVTYVRREVNQATVATNSVMTGSEKPLKATTSNRQVSCGLWYLSTGNKCLEYFPRKIIL